MGASLRRPSSTGSGVAVAVGGGGGGSGGGGCRVAVVVVLLFGWLHSQSSAYKELGKKTIRQSISFYSSKRCFCCDVQVVITKGIVVVVDSSSIIVKINYNQYHHNHEKTNIIPLELIIRLVIFMGNCMKLIKSNCLGH